MFFAVDDGCSIRKNHQLFGDWSFPYIVMANAAIKKADNPVRKARFKSKSTIVIVSAKKNLLAKPKFRPPRRGIFSGGNLHIVSCDPEIWAFELSIT